MTGFRPERSAVPLSQYHSTLRANFDFTSRVPPAEENHLDRKGKWMPEHRHPFSMVHQYDKLLGRCRDDFFFEQCSSTSFDQVKMWIHLIGPVDRHIDCPAVFRIDQRDPVPPRQVCSLVRGWYSAKFHPCPHLLPKCDYHVLGG